ncbi:O-antigen ligase family protein [Sphingomonas sp.]|uniref:O-antigen ligase family protein n=1 Tax=Sphingomonas sp. TaxID=28214 RepID=UPI002FCA7E16
MKFASAPERLSPEWLLLLLLIVSLAFMQPGFWVSGLQAAPTDFIYPLLLVASGIAIVRGRAAFAWQPAYWLLIAYFAAMLVSALAAGFPQRSALKLLTQLYLLSLPVLVCSLVSSQARLRQALLAWLAGSAIVALVGVAAVIAFLIDPESPWFAFARSDFGTLPTGPYPRLWLTFLNPNLLCNYLTVSLVILLVARSQGWLARTPFLLLLGGLLLSAAFTISTGLGGIALAIAIWLWVLLRSRSQLLARLLVAGGIAAAAAFVLAALVTPVIPRDVPFLVHLPGIDRPFAPAVRWLTWHQAIANFLADPMFGRGIGSNAVSVYYWVPWGLHSHLTDAHNAYLNIAVQCGLLGLAALLALIVHVWRRTRLPSPAAPHDLVPFGLGLAFLDAFAYQGLTGSFEDARHLWVLLGLFLASLRLRAVSPEAP